MCITPMVKLPLVVFVEPLIKVPVSKGFIKAREGPLAHPKPSGAKSKATNLEK